jgi:hypothetical protein
MTDTTTPAVAASPQQVVHHMPFDLTTGLIDEARVVDVGGRILRAVNATPSTEKIEFMLQLPNGANSGGGFTGGTGNQGNVAAFVRERLARHGIHFGNNLDDKIGAAAASQAKAEADHQANVAASSTTETDESHS